MIRLVGGVHPDDGQSVSPLAPSPTGGWEGSEEDDGDDVLPASKRRPETPALTAARSSSGNKGVTSTNETIIDEMTLGITETDGQAAGCAKAQQARLARQLATGQLCTHLLAAQAQLGQGAADEGQGVLVAIPRAASPAAPPGTRPRCTCSGCAGPPAGWGPGGSGRGAGGAAPAARQPRAASASGSRQSDPASARAESASRSAHPPLACACQCAAAALCEPGAGESHQLLTISFLSSRPVGLRMAAVNPPPPRRASRPASRAGSWRVLDAFPAGDGAVRPKSLSR